MRFGTRPLRFAGACFLFALGVSRSSLAQAAKHDEPSTGVVAAGRLGMVFETQDSCTQSSDTTGCYSDATSGMGLRLGYRLSSHWALHLDGLTGKSASYPDGADRLIQASLGLEYLLHRASGWFAAADAGLGVFHLAHDTPTGTDRETVLAPSVGARWMVGLGESVSLGPHAEVWLVKHSSTQAEHVPDRQGWRAWVTGTLTVEARF